MDFRVKTEYFVNCIFGFMADGKETERYSIPNRKDGWICVNGMKWLELSVWKDKL